MRKPTFSNIKTCLDCLVRDKDKNIFEIIHINDMVAVLNSPIHALRLVSINELKRDYVLC